jgi:hypothetical protein
MPSTAEGGTPVQQQSTAAAAGAGSRNAPNHTGYLGRDHIQPVGRQFAPRGSGPVATTVDDDEPVDRP